MKKQHILLAVIGLGLFGQAFAQPREVEEWARVKSSEPIYGQATAVQRPQCNTQYVERTVVTPAPVYQQQQQNIGAAIVGGLVGGILGNQVGGGSGKTLATAAGVGIGAVLGNQVGGNANVQDAPVYSQTQTQTVPVENCVTVTEMLPAPIVGYRVVLDHNGRDFVYQTPDAPRSEYIKIRVQVSPQF